MVKADRMLRLFLVTCAAGWLLAAEDPYAPLRIDTHGFASFGYVHSWGNNWLGDTKEGSTEFWEAAMNAVARPIDHLRIGAQLFARDLGRYDNGKVQVDWAYGRAVARGVGRRSLAESPGIGPLIPCISALARA